MNGNYYFEHLTDILKEQGDWLEKVSRYDAAHGVPEHCDAQRDAFFGWVKGKSFHKDGSFEFVWKDGTLHAQPEE